MVEMVPTPWAWFESWWSWWYLVGYLLIGMAVAIVSRACDEGLYDEPGLLGLLAFTWPLALATLVFMGLGKLADLAGKEIGKAIDAWKQLQYERRKRQ